MDTPKETQLLTTNRKALSVNLDDKHYGTFAEIGAGQEVVRHFFQAGGAAGTVAKTISAYDMKFSDAIYGKSPRYVSKDRVELMLQHEYELLIERLEEQRGASTAFFAFADTVAAKSYHGNNECHGWMGVRFQLRPGTPPNKILVHVRMWDKENILQQQALGIFGVNLLFGALYYHDDQDRFIRSLVDNLSPERIEVDMITLEGPDFAHVDNRLMSLKLVENGLTNAVMFGPRGEVLQPSEVLHKKAILVERGSFRPATLVNIDMLRCACAQFVQEPDVKEVPVEFLMEITMHNLRESGQLDPQDFLARVDTLAALGNTVLISNYSEFYRLVSYFRRYSQEMIGIVMGVNNLIEIFNEKYYESLEGGILESFGRLFRQKVKLYVYPMRQDAYERYLSKDKSEARQLADAPEMLRAKVLITARNLQIEPHLRGLYDYLQENHYLGNVTGFDETILHIFAPDVLKKIREKDPCWETMVPAPIAQLIRERELWGYQA